MRRGRPTVKPSLRQQLEDNQRGLDQWAAFSDKPRVVLHTPKPIAPRRENGFDGRKLEAEVQNDIIAYLMQHPLVSVVERANSGAAISASGAPIWFHKIFLTVLNRVMPAKVRKADLDIQLTTGQRVVIECKREGWTKPTDQREREQAAYLDRMRDAGCIAFFAQSVEDCKKHLQ